MLKYPFENTVTDNQKNNKFNVFEISGNNISTF